MHSPVQLRIKLDWSSRQMVVYYSSMKFTGCLLGRGDFKPKYVIHNEVDIFATFIKRALLTTLKPADNYVKNDEAILTFSIRSNSFGLDAKLAALGIGESQKLLNYQVLGGG